MGFQGYVTTLRDMMAQLDKDLKKAPTNKAACQRCRVGSIKLGKEFKSFRQISVEYDREQPPKIKCK